VKEEYSAVLPSGTGTLRSLSMPHGRCIRCLWRKSWMKVGGAVEMVTERKSVPGNEMCDL